MNLHLGLSLVALVLVSCASQETKNKGEAPSEPIQISTDCTSWKEIDSKPPGTAYYKGTGTLSYMDYPNKTYSVFAHGGGEPFIFDYSERGWIHMMSETAFESIPSELPQSKDEIGELMAAIMSAARSSLRTNRWVIYPEKGQYLAWFIGEKCKLEPRAHGAFCDAGSGECTLLPHKLTKPGLAKACLRELGFLEEKRRAPLTKACRHFLAPETRNRITDLVEKSTRCPSVDAPAVRRTSSATCRDLGALFEKLGAN